VTFLACNERKANLQDAELFFWMLSTLSFYSKQEELGYSAAKKRCILQN